MAPHSEAHTGGCQCGAVRFRVRLLGRGSICHCRMCQKAFGGFFGPLVTARDATWTRGEPKWFQSSNSARRGFCGECGTPLAYETKFGLELAIGAFDDPEVAAPKIQVNPHDKVSFVDGLAQLPLARGPRASGATSWPASTPTSTPTTTPRTGRRRGGRHELARPHRHRAQRRLPVRRGALSRDRSGSTTRTSATAGCARRRWAASSRRSSAFRVESFKWTRGEPSIFMSSEHVAARLLQPVRHAAVLSQREQPADRDDHRLARSSRAGRARRPGRQREQAAVLRSARDAPRRHDHRGGRSRGRAEDQGDQPPASRPRHR